jgi:hypothetical protein
VVFQPARSSVLENTSLATGTREHGELTVPGGYFPNRFHSPSETTVTALSTPLQRPVAAGARRRGLLIFVVVVAEALPFPPGSA